jgi:hypothetical protein
MKQRTTSSIAPIASCFFRDALGALRPCTSKVDLGPSESILHLTSAKAIVYLATCSTTYEHRLTCEVNEMLRRVQLSNAQVLLMALLVLLCCAGVRPSYSQGVFPEPITFEDRINCPGVSVRVYREDYGDGIYSVRGGFHAPNLMKTLPFGMPPFLSEPNQAIVMGAQNTVQEVELLFSRIAKDYDSLNRVAELRNLNAFRERLISHETELRIDLDPAKERHSYLVGKKETIDSFVSSLQCLERETSRLNLEQRQQADYQGEVSHYSAHASVYDDLANSDRIYILPRSEKERSDLLQTLNGDIADAKSQASEFDKRVEESQKFIENTRQLLKDVNFDLNKIYDYSGQFLQSELEKSEYTLYATLVFGGLVSLVIVGFFWIAWSSHRVRTAIFAGDSGIQFVTLFSLVIAIILFGILKILEGRELSALLGGISGYILGRSSDGRFARLGQNKNDENEEVSSEESSRQEAETSSSGRASS